MAENEQTEQKPKASESKTDTTTRRTTVDKSEPVTAQTPTTGQWIYIGPTIKQLGLETNSVYTEAIPAYLTKKMDEHDELRQLFIDVAELSQKTVELDTVGSELHGAYQALEAKKGVI